MKSTSDIWSGVRGELHAKRISGSGGHPSLGKIPYVLRRTECTMNFMSATGVGIHSAGALMAIEIPSRPFTPRAPFDEN